VERSWRRTTSVDIVFPPASNDGSVSDFPAKFILSGSGRDLLTLAPDQAADQPVDKAADQNVVVLDTAESHVEIAMATRTVTVVSTRPEHTTIALVGVPASGRFRRVLGECMVDEIGNGTLIAQLLDETPVTALIAGASLARRNLIPLLNQEKRTPTLDVCAGWRTSGEMARAIEDGDAPALEDLSDPHSWHALAYLPIGAMRRRRRIDIAQIADGFSFDVVFRDSYIEPDGSETTVHEYGIAGHCDADGVVTEIIAVPHVIPGPECPLAAASALRLVGASLRDIRSTVSGEFSGISTCTHLNDALRSLGGSFGALKLLAGNAHTTP
jgi:hypothetical protein